MSNEQHSVIPGDYFTHDRTGVRFVCRAVTRHDYSGINSLVRVEIEPSPTRVHDTRLLVEAFNAAHNKRPA